MFQLAELADQAVRQLQRETGQRMKTTVVFLAIENDIDDSLSGAEIKKALIDKFGL